MPFSSDAVRQGQRAPDSPDETLPKLRAALDALESRWRGFTLHARAEAQPVGNTTERKGVQPDLNQTQHAMSTIHLQTTVQATLDMPSILRRGIWALVPTLSVLAGCQATQGLPTVDDAQRRPINSAAAIELQSCKAEASALRATLLETVAPQCPRVEGAVKLAAALPALPAAAPTPAGSTSRVAVFVFEQGQVSLSLDAATREALKDAAAAAEVIHVRGRSGAAQESPADVLAARRRAEAAVAVLKDLGVPAQKLRVSWQGMSDAASEAGQGRRVEIEFADRAPTVLFTRAAVDKGSTVASASTSATGSTVATAGTAATKP